MYIDKYECLKFLWINDMMWMTYYGQVLEVIVNKNFDSIG